MKLIALIYHDIERTPTYRRYSLTIGDFRAHLAAIRGAVRGAPVLPGERGSGFALTFDDGHEGWLEAGEALREFGWRASFFVVTGLLGRAGRLRRADVRRLAEMGHAIGTHTAEHPNLLYRRDDAYILDQWSRSKAILEDIVGAEVTSGALPGGDYRRNVGRAADAAGLRYLFTSEPVVESWRVGDCEVLGRFALTNGMSARRAARIASGNLAERAAQYVLWNAKKAAKAALRGPYQALRARLYPA